MKRVTVIMPDAVYEKLLEQCAKEKRKKSSMAALILERELITTKNEGDVRTNK